MRRGQPRGHGSGGGAAAQVEQRERDAGAAEGGGQVAFEAGADRELGKAPAARAALTDRLEGPLVEDEADIEVIAPEAAVQAFAHRRVAGAGAVVDVTVVRPQHHARAGGLVGQDPADVVEPSAGSQLRHLRDDHRMLAGEIPFLLARGADISVLAGVEPRQQLLGRGQRGGARRRDLLGNLPQPAERARHRLGVWGVDLLEVGGDHRARDLRRLHVEAEEPDLARVGGIGVVGPHPADHVEHFLGVPGPEVEAGERLGRVPRAVQHVVVDRQRLRPVGLDGEHREALLGDQVLEHPMLELEELAGAVRGFAERDDAGLAHDSRQRPQVVVALAGGGGAQRHHVAAKPAHHLRGRGSKARGVERHPLLGTALGDLGLDRLGDEVRRVECDLVLAGGQAEAEAAGAVELAVEEVAVLGAEAADRDPGAGGRRTLRAADRADQVDAAGAQRELDGLCLLADGDRRREGRGETGGGSGHRIPALGDGRPKAAVAAALHHRHRAAGGVGDQRHQGAGHRPSRGIGHRARDRHRRGRPDRLEDHRELAHPGRPVAREERTHVDAGCLRRHVHLDLDPRPGGRAVNAAVHHVVERQHVGRPVHPRPEPRPTPGDGFRLNPALETEMPAARRLDREAGRGDAERPFLHGARGGPPGQAQALQAAGGAGLLSVEPDVVTGAAKVPLLPRFRGGESKLGASHGGLGRRGRRWRRSGLARGGLGGSRGEQRGRDRRQRRAGQEPGTEERQASQDGRSCPRSHPQLGDGARFWRHGGALLSGADRSRFFANSILKDTPPPQARARIRPGRRRPVGQASLRSGSEIRWRTAGRSPPTW